MNAKIQEFWNINRMYAPLRAELLDCLTDADLAFSPGGHNPSLGALCREIGDTQYAYIQSFKTFKIDFSYGSENDAHLHSVEKLRAWYAQLDADLQAALEAISDEVAETQQVDRGDFKVPLHINLDLYREALLIFYGKVSVYAKALGNPLTQTWQLWIA